MVLPIYLLAAGSPVFFYLALQMALKLPRGEQRVSKPHTSAKKHLKHYFARCYKPNFKSSASRAAAEHDKSIYPLKKPAQSIQKQLGPERTSTTIKF
jgi:hypothetical protein